MRNSLSRTWDESLAGRTKRFGDTLKHVLPPMLHEIAERPQFFDTVEKLYSIYEVPVDLQAKLLIPLLTPRAKTVIGRMPATEMEQYEALKGFLLAEFKLTPREYKARFDDAAKRSDETYVLFAARLRNLLAYYLRSRKIGNDFDKLCDLIVSDRLKGALPYGPLNYVLSLEGDDWYNPDRVATLSDIYVNNHPARSGESKPVKISAMKANADVDTEFTTPKAIHKTNYYNGGGVNPSVRRCYNCQSTAHLAKACPRGRGYRGGFRGRPGKAHVNFCSTLVQPPVDDASVQCNRDVEEEHINEFDTYPKVDAITASRLPGVKISQLPTVEVNVSGINCKALCDSGAQITVVNDRLFEFCKGDAIGSIMLQGAFNSAVQAPLVNLTLRLCDTHNACNIMPELPVVCAVTDIQATGYDVILPTDVERELRELPVISVLKPTVSNCVGVSGHELRNSASESLEVVSVDKPISSTDNCDVDRLVDEQKRDLTLAHCWKLAQENKMGFKISRGLIFHKDTVEGQTVCQLCVPEGRRGHVLKLAHDSVFGGHMGEKKTRERIRLSFYWPGLRRDVKEYVTSCSSCQLRSRVTTTDRVPITPITRADIPFQVLNLDCIGPLDPPSAQGHQYCLCIVDSCTRWPAVYMLKSLSAKAVCDALLDLFVNVGVPKVIVTDRGTNFTSQLTRELLGRLGCSPRFNTPGHPEASGLVERFNQTCKNMLHHIVQQHQRQWHKFVPLMVWALREVPNATTGVSPYMLVYGRTPRGPLAVLKESWTGERDLDPNFGKPVEEYLCDLKAKLETAAEFANQHAQRRQEGYAAHYNLRARDKKFLQGEQVIILAPENASKLSTRWQGPATVVEVKSPHSYLVDMGNGNVRHVHANKMRRFVARVQGCGVIAESDVDFGRILIPVSQPV